MSIEPADAATLRTHRPRWTWAVCIGLWVACVLAGLGGLLAYSAAPGAEAAAPEHGPTTPGARLTMVVAIHPRCPCSIATLDNLERLATRCGGALGVRILMAVPGMGVGDAGGIDAEAWRGGRAWSRARRVPGASVIADAGAAEALSYGARTSGAVAVYDASCALVYAGGITTSRGHAGENAITDALHALAMGREATLPEGRVFGCALEGGAW